MDAGKETILVVEDDPRVRNYVIAQLRGFGYTTIAAENAAEALAVVHHGTSSDLLFTDIVMPGASDGSELAKEVRRLRPSEGAVYVRLYGQRDRPSGAHWSPACCCCKSLVAEWIYPA
jgi:CheY-like chemotaxis protein